MPPVDQLELPLAGASRPGGRSSPSPFCQFLLEHGQEFIMSPDFPADLPFGKRGQCYEASGLVAANPRYVYCEGVACIAGWDLPLAHAWVYDTQAHIGYDPSWKPIGRAYFGVPVRSQYWMKATIKTGTWDVVNDWMRGWPMTKLSAAEWRDPRAPFTAERGEHLNGMLALLERGVTK